MTGGKKIGRPRIEIDWEDFDKLCAMQATLNEIAGWFRCSTDTIERAVEREHGVGFADYFAEKRGAGKVALRRAQFDAACAGNATMLVWLGKQWLGQTDTQRIEHSGDAIPSRLVLVSKGPDNSGGS